MAVNSHEFDAITRIFDRLSPEEREEVLRRLEERCPTVDEEGASRRSLLEAMNERGMVGSIKNAPPDWSTNPEYLEGLGQDAR